MEQEFQVSVYNEEGLQVGSGIFDDFNKFYDWLVKHSWNTSAFYYKMYFFDQK